MEEFEVNKYITLKLEGEKVKKTNIYVNGKLFRQCKYLLLNIPIRQVSSYNEINSIDEAMRELNSSLQENSKIKEIPPETEFWGHCSNLHVWYENNYDTRLIHSNLAFPLLKKLTESGDPLAQKVFKEEIAQKIKNGSIDTIRFLINNRFHNYLSREELFESLLDIKEFYALAEIEHYNEFEWVFGRFKKPQEIYPNLGIQNREIIELSLNNMGLNKIPHSIINLRSLTGLYLSENFLTKIPEWVYDIKSLRFLDLSYNQLRNLPEQIQNLNLLQELWLGYNEISSLPESMNKLKELEFIDLRKNKLSNMDLDKIKQMKKSNKKLKIIL
ncbi:MAG: leucine-rich repeat domain-containing protein [Promethearchaeota archaeon]